MPGTAQPVGPPLQREYATGFLPTGVRQSLCRVSNLVDHMGPALGAFMPSISLLVGPKLNPTSPSGLTLVPEMFS